LANILAAKAPNEEITFIHKDDLELYNKWDSKAFELQVANHELLGHGMHFNQTMARDQLISYG
jgi:dipeptidyl-peptidase-3